MDEIKQKLRRGIGILEKFKYPLLILLIGVILMSIPFDNNKEENENVPEKTVIDKFDLEARLREILIQIEGVGDAEVLLSPETSCTYSYQEDTQIRTTADTEELQQQTVVVSGGGTERPIEVSVTYPTYKGAIIVCGGADKPSVKLAVVQAVSGATGLSSDHITVIKMKGY